MTPENLKPANADDVRRATRKVAEKGDTGLMAAARPEDGDTGTVQKKAGGLSPRAWTIIAFAGVIAIVGGFLVANHLFGNKPEIKRLPEIVIPHLQSTGEINTPSFKPFDAAQSINRTSRQAAVATLANPIDPSDIFGTIADREEKQLGGLTGEGSADFSVLATGLLGETDSSRARPDTVDLSPPKDRSATELPADRVDHRIARSPSEYPESGLNPQRYWIWLRNALNRPEGSDIDLEKAWIILSMYYNPQLDPQVYLAWLNDLTAELYSRLAPLDAATGERRIVTDGRERVRILSDFMQHGMGPYLGWEVEDYRPDVVHHGQRPEKHRMLVNEVLMYNPRERNRASNTAMNILTLILLRKLEKQTFTFEGRKQPSVMIPIYGVRLPGRSILRYDSMGKGRVVPDQDNVSMVSSGAGTLNDEAFGDQSGPRIEADVLGYARNIEFLRNGNHYDGEDYVRRFSISDSDRAQALYLRTLSDKRFFATLGYELAQIEITRGSREGYDRARLLLEEWVLDRDDGTIGPRSAKKAVISEVTGRPRSQPPVRFPRGDEDFRDAYLLYAEMLLQQSEFASIREQLDVNPVIRNSPERAATIRALLAAHANRIDSATAYLEDALAMNDDNPRAHLLLGDIHFIRDDGTTPVATRGTYMDPLTRALEHFDKAFAFDNRLGRLAGSERRLLHFHRGLARYRQGMLDSALEDLTYLGKISPEFAETPAYASLLRDVQIDRAFVRLTTNDGTTNGNQKLVEAEFLRQDLLDGVESPATAPGGVRLNPAWQQTYLRVTAALPKIDVVVVRLQLLNALQEATGHTIAPIAGDERHEQTARAWERWIKQHYSQNQ